MTVAVRRVLKILIGGLLVAVLLPVAGLFSNRPPLFREPGLKVRLSTYLTENVAATQPGHPFPELRSRRYRVEPDRLLEAARQAAAALGWRIQAIHRDQYHLNAVASTPLWRFKDDVSVRIEAVEDGSRLEVRSESRLGQGDLAANSRRIMDFHREIEKRL